MHTQWARSDPFRLTPLATLSLTRVFAMKAAPTHPNMKLNPEQAPCSYISSNYQQTPSKVLTNFQKVILVYFHPYCSRFLFQSQPFSFVSPAL